MKKRMSWYWALPGAVALALVLVAVTSWASGPVARAQTATPTTAPTATATVNPACQLKVNKTADASTVPENGTATFTIEITNDGNGDCVDPTISDVIPDHTDCDTADVASTSDITDIDISGCKASGTVKWKSNDNFGKNDTVVLTLALTLESAAHEGNHISNEACVTSTSDVNGDCDSARITVGTAATATPQPTATRAATAIPSVIAPPPIPTARPLATIAPPITGTGPGGGTGPLALGLGLVGACLLLVSGAAMVKRTR